MRARILLTDDLTDGLVLVVLELQQGLLLGAPWLLAFLFLGVLAHDLVRLHKAVVIFVHDVVFLGMDGRVRPLRRCEFPTGKMFTVCTLDGGSLRWVQIERQIGSMCSVLLKLGVTHLLAVIVSKDKI